MGYLDHDARTVTGLGVSSLGAAVHHVLEHLEALLDKAVAFQAPGVDQEPHATSVMLVTRIIKSLSFSYHKQYV